MPQQPTAPELAPSYTESTGWGEDKAGNTKGKQKVPPQLFPLREARGQREIIIQIPFNT